MDAFLAQVVKFFQQFFGSFINVAPETWIKYLVMWIIGGTLIFLAIKKDMEPTLLLPMGFGTLLVNLPFSGAINQTTAAGTETEGVLDVLFNAGIANELFPLLLFIGIGAMIDFSPLLTNPKLMLFGAAAQLGIFLTFAIACIFFNVEDAASIAAIGTADGPTSIFISSELKSQFQGAIMVAAYSYMALVPIIQPPVIRALTTKKERMIRMESRSAEVPKYIKILFPIVITVVAGLFAPTSVSLVGFLMFGNLIRECGVLRALSESAQHELANLVTILLGITVSLKMNAEQFLRMETLIILAIGLFAFVLDTAGGVLFAKYLNLFLRDPKKKINPMVGACGISAFPMSSRVIHKMGIQEDPQNFLIMHAAGVNSSGQIASVIAGGLLLMLVQG